MPAIVLACGCFAAGLVAGLLLAPAPWLLGPAGVLLAVVLLRRGVPQGALALCLAAGSIWGALARTQRLADCRLHWRDGDRVAALVEPLDIAAGGSPARRFRIVSPSACAGEVAVLLPARDTVALRRIIIGTWHTDPAFHDAPVPLRPERAGRIEVLAAHPLGVPLGLRARLRVGAERRLQSLFGAAHWPLAAALTLRAEGALPQETRRTFARAGLAHVLAISGLHVGLLFGAIFLLLRLVRLPPPAARLAGVLLIGGYVWLLGAPAPALRAALLLVLWWWARLRQRPPRSSGLVATAALVILVADPWALFDAGPWLSFAGVVGCTAAARAHARLARESRRGRRYQRLLSPLAVSAGAVVATTPVQLVAFGTMSPVAVLTNLIAVPVTAALLPALALALVAPLAVAAVPAAAADVCLGVLERVAALGASAPLGTIEPDSPLLAAAIALGAALWLLRPLPRERAARSSLAVRAATAGLAVLASLCWTRALRGLGADGDGRLALHFLAVGQGDAAAIRTPHGHWIVIDGGARWFMDQGSRKVVPFLRRSGARSVDVVVSSHGDADHLGGLHAVLGAFPVGLALEPGLVLGRPLYAEWLADVSSDQARWHPARAGDSVMVDGVKLRVWHPDSATLAAGWPDNENSVVLTLEYGAFRALFGGDAGLRMEALRGWGIGRVTVLKVGHHGSPGASGPEWIAALAPRLCVIEVGRNHYGHPDAAVVARLERAGCAVYRTDHDGDVDVRTDGQRVDVRAGGRSESFIASKEQT